MTFRLWEGQSRLGRKLMRHRVPWGWGGHPTPWEGSGRMQERT